MATPTNRDEFKKFILRKLGHPVIRVNVTDEQIDDRIDEALNRYRLFHYDGTEKLLLSHQLTQPEVDSKSIILDDNITNVTEAWQIGFSSNLGGGSMLFNVPYQVLVSDIFGADGSMSSTGGISNYVIMRESLNVLSEFMVGRFPIRYNEKTNVVYLDVNQGILVAGQYMVLEAYSKTLSNPDTWGDLWLQRYATELVRQNWGESMSKFAGQMLPGGVTINGLTMKAEAEQKLAALEEELESSWGAVLPIIVG